MKPDPHITHLLERYMQAETTKTEERELADYFKAHPDLPAEWLPYAVMLLGGTAVTTGHKRRLWPWMVAVGTAACVALVLLLRPGPTDERLFAQSAETHSPTVATAVPSHQTTADVKPVFEEKTTDEPPSQPDRKPKATAGPISHNNPPTAERTEAELRQEIELLLEAQALEREEEENTARLLVEVLLAAHAQE
ncbi:MAG: hypothetical protein ACI4V2_06845 [Alloprevotella sp.]